MAIYVGVALALLVRGLVVCALAESLKSPILVKVAWWLGLLLAVCGVPLFLAPLAAFLAATLRQALGV
jgi:hypothetical protein